MKKAIGDGYRRWLRDHGVLSRPASVASP